MSERLPNIVLIILDSVRRDHVSCYGYERRTTPHIDRIAREGTIYRRASSASCWTLPSHASLFTGLYPSEHRVDLDTQHLDPAYETLASRLRKRGFATASISCNGWVTPHSNLTHGFDLAVDVGELAGGDDGFWPRAVRTLHRRWRRLTERDRGAERATRMAEEWLKRRTLDQPFMLFLNYMDCHLPYKLQGRHRYHFVEDGREDEVDEVPQEPFAVMAGRETLSAQDLEDLKSLYDGCLHYLDEHVARLDGTLHELGFADDTVLVVTSDHGESFGEHGLMDHQYGLYENLLSVPLVIRFPGKQGRAEDGRLVQLVDLVPTLVEAAGGNMQVEEAPAARSLFGSSERDVALAEYLVPNVRAIRRRFPDAGTEAFNVALRSVTDGTHKLITGSDGRVELYDLDADPGERTNLSSTRPDVVARLQSRLNDVVGDWPVRQSVPGPKPVDAAVRSRLENLGYL